MTLESRFELNGGSRWIQVDAGVGEVAVQDVEVVAVVEDVGGELGHRSSAYRQLALPGRDW